MRYLEDGKICFGLETISVPRTRSDSRLEGSWDVIWFHSNSDVELEYDRELDPDNFGCVTSSDYGEPDMVVVRDEDDISSSVYQQYYGYLKIGDTPALEIGIRGNLFFFRFLFVEDENPEDVKSEEAGTSSASEIWGQLDREGGDNEIFFGSTKDDNGNPFIVVNLTLKNGTLRLVMKKRVGSEGMQQVPYTKLTVPERARLGYGLIARDLNPRKLLEKLQAQASEMTQTISYLQKFDFMEVRDVADFKTVEEIIAKMIAHSRVGTNGRELEEAEGRIIE